jgi:hypothetical protein
VLEDQQMGIKKILKIISQVLGFVRVSANFLPKPPTSASARRETTIEVIGVLGRVFNIA